MIMKLKQCISVILGLLISISIQSCGSEYIDAPQLKPGNALSLKSHITPENAESRLKTIISQIEKQTPTSTRSVATRITGCKPLARNGEELKRSEEAYYYYFSINNGEKYALMSARADLPELLALGQGSPSWENPSSLIPDPTLLDGMLME